MEMYLPNSKVYPSLLLLNSEEHQAASSYGDVLTKLQSLPLLTPPKLTRAPSRSSYGDVLPNSKDYPSFPLLNSVEHQGASSYGDEITQLKSLTLLTPPKLRRAPRSLQLSRCTYLTPKFTPPYPS